MNLFFGPWKENEINLTEIKSTLSKNKAKNYEFYVTAECDNKDKIEKTVNELKPNTDYIDILKENEDDQSSIWFNYLEEKSLFLI